MKDLSVVCTILGMRVSFEGGEICLSQTHYVARLLKEWEYEGMKEIATSYDPYKKHMIPIRN